MTRVVVYITTQWGRLSPKTKPPVAGKANQGSLTTTKESLVLSVATLAMGGGN